MYTHTHPTDAGGRPWPWGPLLLGGPTAARGWHQPLTRVPLRLNSLCPTIRGPSRGPGLHVPKDRTNTARVCRQVCARVHAGLCVSMRPWAQEIHAYLGMCRPVMIVHLDARAAGKLPKCRTGLAAYTSPGAGQGTRGKALQRIPPSARQAWSWGGAKWAAPSLLGQRSPSLEPPINLTMAK